MTRGARFSIGLCSGVIIAAATLCAATAAPRNPGDYLTLDLKSAVLSPEPLGPESRFQPLGVEAHSEVTLPATTGAAATKTAAAPATSTPATPQPARVAHMSRPHHHYAQRRHGNPLDAQASTPRPRIQRWPCNTGGICGWQ